MEIIKIFSLAAFLLVRAIIIVILQRYKKPSCLLISYSPFPFLIGLVLLSACNGPSEESKDTVTTADNKKSASLTIPLPSWNDGTSKKAILDFVKAVTTEGNASFVKEGDRIAVFDNDGTLWVEQPLYTQFLFSIDRVKAIAPQHPEWKNKDPFKSILAGDMKKALAGGEKAVVELMMATHVGMTTDEFARIVKDWR